MQGKERLEIKSACAIPQKGELRVYVFLLFTLTVPALGVVIEGTEMRSWCGPALEEVWGSCADPHSWCGGLSSPSFITHKGSSWTKVHPGNQHSFVFPLSVLLLHKTHEMEEETVSPLGPPSCSQKFLHTAWRASEAGLEDQCLYNTVLKTVLWNQQSNTGTSTHVRSACHGRAAGIVFYSICSISAGLSRAISMSLPLSPETLC